MFKNATFFRIAADFTLPPLEQLEAALQSAQFLHCGPTQQESSGWVAPRGNKSTILAEAVGQQVILQLCTERRQLPASAVKDTVDAMIAVYKQQTGNERVGRSLRRPIGTITTRDRHAVIDGDRMRMISVQEARAAMGFPETYRLPERAKDAMHMLGNAVCPPVARDVINAIRAAA
ncbi:C-5 cytosine-specific DNA methylase [Polaromonas sp. OV174]|uniref:recombination-associated protein RdgC n=1 Tax=Polaromonas sp. OV174 TaxID=1855300 RepID=UPI0008E47F2C|nr:recombination-associated protein RdgC [Polaromonas sp. OV174]SFB74697.1 C-5 cytosine-specific DNA methylase [Polaromonas sp. OV174]